MCKYCCLFFLITRASVLWLVNDTDFSLLGWLDDIGLPQYKTQFDEGRVDGRMLHYMTVVSDLLLGLGKVKSFLSEKHIHRVSKIQCFHNDSTRV